MLLCFFLSGEDDGGAARLSGRGDSRLLGCLFLCVLFPNADRADTRQQSGVVGNDDEEEQAADQREDTCADAPSGRAVDEVLEELNNDFNGGLELTGTVD